MNAAIFALIGLGIGLLGWRLASGEVRSFDRDGARVMIGGALTIAGVFVVLASGAYALVRSAFG